MLDYFWHANRDNKMYHKNVLSTTPVDACYVPLLISSAFLLPCPIQVVLELFDNLLHSLYPCDSPMSSSPASLCSSLVAQISGKHSPTPSRNLCWIGLNFLSWVGGQFLGFQKAFPSRVALTVQISHPRGQFWV